MAKLSYLVKFYVVSALIKFYVVSALIKFYVVSALTDILTSFSNAAIPIIKIWLNLSSIMTTSLYRVWSIYNLLLIQDEWFQ